MSTSTIPAGLYASGPLYTVDQINAAADTILVNVPNPILVNMDGACSVYCPAGQYQLNADVAGHWYFQANGGAYANTASAGNPIINNRTPGQPSRSPLLCPVPGGPRAWNPSVNYGVGQQVVFNGHIYTSAIAGYGNQPGTSSKAWQQVAS